MGKTMAFHYKSHGKKQQIFYHFMSYTPFRKTLFNQKFLDQHKNNLVKFTDFWMLNMDISVIGTKANHQPWQGCTGLTTEAEEGLALWEWQKEVQLLAARSPRIPSFSAFPDFPFQFILHIFNFLEGDSSSMTGMQLFNNLN